MNSNKGTLLEPSAQDSLANQLRRPCVFLLLISAVTLALYSGTLSFGFIWDDYFQIVNNPLIRSWHTLPRVFVSNLWVHTGSFPYYRPLFVAWSMLNYALFALRTWGWHLGAILLHVAASCSVYLLARKLGLEHWTAALAAIMFALHPIHVETTAWISAGSDTMVAVFCLLAFLAFLNSRDPQQKWKARWGGLSLLLFACGLLTKEMATSFAGLIATYVWLNPAEDNRANFWHRVWGCITVATPYVLVTLGYLGLRTVALRHVVFRPEYTVAQLIMTLPAVLFGYLRLLIAPFGLTAFYYTPYVSSAGIRTLYGPVVALLLVIVLVQYWARRTNDTLVSFAGLWMIITILPALYLPGLVEGAFIRDRYAYLPSVGFMLLAAKAIRLIPAIRNYRSNTLQTAATLVLAFTFATGCLSQQVYWANEMLLYYRGHSLYPESTEATIAYAGQLIRHHRPGPAIALLEQAIKQRPDLGGGYYGLAEAYLQAGQREKARAALQTALKLLPVDQRESEVGMADLAGMYGRLGEPERALDLCSRLLAKAPDLYSGLYNCANLNLSLGRSGEAERLLARAVQVAPGQAPAHFLLGLALLEGGKGADADPQFRRAIELDPDKDEYHFSLGQLLERQSKVQDARKEYLQVLRLNPAHLGAKRRLANLTATR